jgi:long-chain-fatty-acid--CoA ligase ACSBG
MAQTFKGKGTFWCTDARDELQVRMGDAAPANNPPETIMSVFQATVKAHGDKVALNVKREGQWKSWTWKQYFADVLQFGRALMHIGLQPHQCISILGFNCPEWFIANNGVIAAGGIATGIYTTNGPEACRYIIDHSESVAVIVENEAQLNKILQVRAQLPTVKAIVVWSGNFQKGEGIYSWQEFLELGNFTPAEEIQKRIDDQKPTYCSTLIYTSGTTGPPKAVMISHDNVTWTTCTTIPLIKSTHEEIVVSYLPLSHIAAQLMDIHIPMRLGSTIYFAQPDALKGSLGNTLKEVRPTMFLGVPRVWEKIHEKMREIGRSSGPVKQAIGNWAKGVGLAGGNAKQKGESLPWGWWLASHLVFGKVRAALGLDRARICVTSAAPIARETINYFLSLDIPLLEIYGMSECTGPETINIPERFLIGSVGRSLPGTELRLDNPDAEGNGEICWRGRHVFMGYMKNDQATAEAIDDQGWLHSGDVGKLDANGFLFITGRIKELIITAGGENIPPVLIEDELKKELGAVISNVMVVGDRRKFLSCLFTIRAVPVANPVEGQYPITDEIEAGALKVMEGLGSQARTVGEAAACPKLKEWIEGGVARANKRATSNAQLIRKFAVLSQDFAIENDCLTPTMKLKRRVVAQKYASLIDQIYAEAEAAGVN